VAETNKNKQKFSKNGIKPERHRGAFNQHQMVMQPTKIGKTTSPKWKNSSANMGDHGS